MAFSNEQSPAPVVHWRHKRMHLTIDSLGAQGNYHPDTENEFYRLADLIEDYEKDVREIQGDGTQRTFTIFDLHIGPLEVTVFSPLEAGDLTKEQFLDKLAARQEMFIN